MKKWAVYRFILLFSIFTGWLPCVYADEPDNILRYKQKLQHVTGQERMEVLKSLAHYYSDTISEIAFGYAAQYMKLAEINNSLFHQARANQIFASIYKYQINYRKSLEHNKEALRLYRMSGDSVWMARQYYNISDNYSFLNRFDSALIYNDSGYNYYKNISSMLVELFSNELEKEKQLHDQQLRLTRLEAERNNMNVRQLILFASLIFVIVLLIGYFLMNRIRMTKKLEQQVEERTQALVENEKKLIEVAQTKDRFYSIIAHDLKSPFNSLIGFSNLLHDDYDDFSDEERKQFITIVRNSSVEIFDLLENLLDWTRKSSDNINFKPIKLDLQRIVKQTIQLQEKNAVLKKIAIENNIPKNTFVQADENMLRTIVRNLTSNAIKFTNPEGKVIFSSAAQNGFVECSIADNGIGMSKKTLGQLFELTRSNRKKGTANEKGTGLGLLLCKDFVERHSGKLTVESHENKGSKFTFTLPLK